MAVLTGFSSSRQPVTPAARLLGAALAVHNAENPGSSSKPATQEPDAMQGAYLGPSYEQSDIERRLAEKGAIFSVTDDAGLIEQTAAALAEGQAVGWHQGRMELARVRSAIVRFSAIRVARPCRRR